MFIFFHFNLSVLTIILAKNFSFIVLMHFKRKFVVWLCASFWLCQIIVFKYLEQHEDIGKLLNLNDLQCYEFLILLSWNILKSISFSIDFINSEDKQTSDTFDLINIFGYSLYFPNLLLGPFMLFDRYNEMRRNASPLRTGQDTRSRMFTLMIDLSRACFWFLFTDFALHFIYLGNLQHNTEVRLARQKFEKSQRQIQNLMARFHSKLYFIATM